MVCPPTGRRRFDALCMALGLPDSCSPPAYCLEPQPQKLRVPAAGGVRKVQQRQTKLAAAAAAAAAAEHGGATPPRVAEQRRCRQPFALGRPPRPVPAVRRALHVPQQLPQAAGSCDSVTSPNAYTCDSCTHSHGVTSPAPPSTGTGACGVAADAAAILAAGMRLILASMSPFDARQLAAARSFLAAVPTE